jgi:hypothetical protein
MYTRQIITCAPSTIGQIIGNYSYFRVVRILTQGTPFPLTGIIYDQSNSSKQPGAQEIEVGQTYYPPGGFTKVSFTGAGVAYQLLVEYGVGTIDKGRLLARLGDLIVTPRRVQAGSIAIQGGTGAITPVAFGSNTAGLIVHSIYCHAVGAGGVRGLCQLQTNNFQIESGTADSVTVDRAALEMLIPAGVGLSLNVVGADSIMIVEYTLLGATNPTGDTGYAPIGQGGAS